MTYLILHKVAGQPSFDVAERCDDMGTASDPGPWWIIPTSGHRAFPYKIVMELDMAPEAVPDDWPDHYQQKILAKQTATKIEVLTLEDLGL